MARIVGNEGTVSISGHGITANAWSMSVSRVVSDVTAFGDNSSNFVGGIPTYTGSISGFMAKDAASTAPALEHTSFNSDDESDIVLTAASGCTYTGKGVISGVSISTSKTGDATISFDFSFTGDVSEVWDQS
tara:strand:- start:300 stop:695 length:396 start_codon:yes stop_codon:yes gene_type:complete